jgi:hypothetical protein
MRWLGMRALEEINQRRKPDVWRTARSVSE